MPNKNCLIVQNVYLPEEIILRINLGKTQEERKKNMRRLEEFVKGAKDARPTSNCAKKS